MGCTVQLPKAAWEAAGGVSEKREGDATHSTRRGGRESRRGRDREAGTSGHTRALEQRITGL